MNNIINAMLIINVYSPNEQNAIVQNTTQQLNRSMSETISSFTRLDFAHVSDDEIDVSATTVSDDESEISTTNAQIPPYLANRPTRSDSESHVISDSTRDTNGRVIGVIRAKLRNQSIQAEERVLEFLAQQRQMNR